MAENISNASHPTPPGEQVRVFLSHSLRDKELANFVANQLKAGGIDARTVDTQLASGSEIREALKTAIRGADATISLVTPESIDSDWMPYEIGLASALDRNVILIAVDVPADQLPESISHRPMLRLDQLDQIQSFVRDAMMKKEAQP